MKTSLRVLCLLSITLITVTWTSVLYADEPGCYGGWWELLEETRDQWGYPAPPYQYKTYGRSMGFWVQPTSCIDTKEVDGYLIENIKYFACVIPSYTKIQSAADEGSCTITGHVVGQTGTWTYNYVDKPCFVGTYMGGSGYGSGYGEVITAKRTLKYEWKCPPVKIPPDLGCPVSN